eukprot:Phypoly_transcript_12377.p2 GENE.Phypoly_transcript_12377~~Phypoly_transcript_12377.p2  ORF type:complete len:127 (-),score=20.66 Phypoly_transcript_12377:267-647(-)
MHLAHNKSPFNSQLCNTSLISSFNLNPNQNTLNLHKLSPYNDTHCILTLLTPSLNMHLSGPITQHLVEHSQSTSSSAPTHFSKCGEYSSPIPEEPIESQLIPYKSIKNSNSLKAKGYNPQLIIYFQ